jgi:FtsP/CotA-like multicopper oxidase with cupredoxin domain
MKLNITKTALLISLLLSIVVTCFSEVTVLEVKYKTIIVNGKAKKVATIEQPNRTWGYYADAGSTFNVTVKNLLDEPTLIHWHGLILPNNQDGVPGLTQAQPIAPSKTYSYKFKLQQTGTYWMHSHYGFQEQNYVEAPLIVETRQDKKMQQVVAMFQDFSFQNPEEIYKNLRANNMQMNISMSMAKPDLNDVKYDAFLTNYHSNESPLIVMVTPNSKVKLRLINGAAQTNFWINLGKLTGTLVAIDGQDIVPIKDNLFQLALAKRLDIIVNIPKNGVVFPILAQVEGLKNQTGLILSTTTNPTLKTINDFAKNDTPAFNYNQDIRLHSLEQIPQQEKPVKLNVVLSGNMQKYIWQINGQTWPNVKPLTVKQGQHVQMTISNKSPMEHPMHLHGYTFKIVNINGKKVNGSMNDTVMVLPNTQVTVEFIAKYPGKWALHCHMLYHMEAGMFTYLNVLPNQ